MAAMPTQPGPRALEHRGVVLVEPGLLPALVPDAWEEAGEAGGVRLVRAGGRAAGTRSFLLAPTASPAEAMRGLAAEGAAAFLYVSTCTSPSRALEPGDVIVVERATSADGEWGANPGLVAKLARRAANHGVRAKVGRVASNGQRAGSDDLAEDARAASVLAGGFRLAVPTGAMLVCVGPDDAGSEAPAAVLESFDRVFGVLQEILGSARRPAT